MPGLFQAGRDWEHPQGRVGSILPSLPNFQRRDVMSPQHRDLPTSVPMGAVLHIGESVAPSHRCPGNGP